MKKSEALKIIDDVYGKFVQDWLEADIDNLTDFKPLNSRILEALLDAGMYPPDTNLKDCSDPVVQVYVDDIDIPHWVTLGWDDEEKEQ